MLAALAFPFFSFSFPFFLSLAAAAAAAALAASTATAAATVTEPATITAGAFTSLKSKALVPAFTILAHAFSPLAVLAAFALATAVAAGPAPAAAATPAVAEPATVSTAAFASLESKALVPASTTTIAPVTMPAVVVVAASTAASMAETTRVAKPAPAALKIAAHVILLLFCIGCISAVVLRASLTFALAFVFALTLALCAPLIRALAASLAQHGGTPRRVALGVAGREGNDRHRIEWRQTEHSDEAFGEVEQRRIDAIRAGDHLFSDACGLYRRPMLRERLADNAALEFFPCDLAVKGRHVALGHQACAERLNLCGARRARSLPVES